MKELTAQRLIKVLLEQNSNLKTIQSCDIARIRHGLMDMSIRVSLTSLDFREMSCAYPTFINITETSIIIRNGRHFKQILEQKFVYSQDKELDRIVVKIWKKRNEY